jgi:hypothetical protein
LAHRRTIVDYGRTGAPCSHATGDRADDVHSGCVGDGSAYRTADRQRRPSRFSYKKQAAVALDDDQNNGPTLADSAHNLGHRVSLLRATLSVSPKFRKSPSLNEIDTVLRRRVHAWTAPAGPATLIESGATTATCGTCVWSTLPAGRACGGARHVRGWSRAERPTCAWRIATGIASWPRSKSIRSPARPA